MNNHLKNKINRIHQLCHEFLTNQRTLIELQSDIAAISSSFENDLEQSIQDAIYNFVGRLEYIRFMHSAEEHYEETKKEIEKLMQFLKPYLNNKKDKL